MEPISFASSGLFLFFFRFDHPGLSGMRGCPGLTIAFRGREPRGGEDESGHLCPEYGFVDSSVDDFDFLCGNGT